jgi:hypothetical protein
MTLNQYCLAMYGTHWILLPVLERKVAWESWSGKNPTKAFFDLFGKGVFGG